MIIGKFSSTEIKFFNVIKKYCNVIFDVGCRDDVDYLKNSYDRVREFHLFDPDPTFIANCSRQVQKLQFNEELEVDVYYNTFGLGSQEGKLSYFPNTQSFVFRTHHTRSHDVGVSFLIKTLDQYCEEKTVKSIDFLKVDVEGMEIDCFNGGKKIIKENTKIIQFEYASTMIDRDVNPDDLVGWFGEDFDIYLLQVAIEHPYYSKNDQLLTPLNEKTYTVIKNDMMNGSGCNLVAIRKEYSSAIYEASL